MNTHALLGRTVNRLWRLVAVSDDGAIPLPGTMVFETDSGFVTISYTQQGLSCGGPVPRNEIRWDVEPELELGKRGHAEEWLDMAPLESPEVPLRAETVTGWFGAGDYVVPFALIVGGVGRELVVMTTDDFELRFATRRQAWQRAELIAANLNLELIEQQL